MTSVSDGHSHSLMIDGKRHVWFIKRLWELSKHLPIFEYAISDFKELDEDVWFGDRIKPTIKMVLEHHRKIAAADYSHPIILSADGIVMDGVHRICRAHLEGKTSIPAVRFKENPPADQII